MANSLFQAEQLTQIGHGDLSYTSPPDDEIHIGQFPAVAVVAAKEFGIEGLSIASRVGSAYRTQTGASLVEALVDRGGLVARDSKRKRG